MFELPLMSNDRIRQIVFCCAFDIEDGTSAHVWMKENSGQKVAKLDDSDVLVRRLVNLRNSRGHFHLEAAVPGVLRNPPRARFELDDVLATVEELEGISVEAMIMSRRRIAFDSLPSQGALATLLGLTTEANGSELTLTGCKLSVQGDGVITKVVATSVSEETLEIGVGRLRGLYFASSRDMRSLGDTTE